MFCLTVTCIYMYSDGFNFIQIHYGTLDVVLSWPTCILYLAIHQTIEKQLLFVMLVKNLELCFHWSYAPSRCSTNQHNRLSHYHWATKFKLTLCTYCYWIWPPSCTIIHHHGTLNTPSLTSFQEMMNLSAMCLSQTW